MSNKVKSFLFLLSFFAVYVYYTSVIEDDLENNSKVTTTNYDDVDSTVNLDID